MTSILRSVTFATALALAAGAVASAATMEVTLTVPLKLTLPPPGKTSPAAQGNPPRLRDYDVSCAIGTNLGYATGVGAQGQIVGQGSTATGGSKTDFQNPDGSYKPGGATATVIITYDGGPAGAPPKPVPNYLCWIQWNFPNALAPYIVQGNLALK